MLKDLRYALRILRKNPGFVAVAVCSLAIGIGATSAIYSRVVAVSPITGQMFAGMNGISYPDYKDFRDHNRTFKGLVASAYSFFGFAPDPATLPRMKFGMFVSGNFFDVLGVAPAIGRAFRAEEDKAVGRDAVAVLSHDFWMSEYGARQSAIGETTWLNGIEFTIVGVAPESFTGTDQFLAPAFYVPAAMSPRSARLRSGPSLHRSALGKGGRSESWALETVGNGILRPGRQKESGARGKGQLARRPTDYGPKPARSINSFWTKYGCRPV